MKAKTVFCSSALSLLPLLPTGCGELAARAAGSDGFDTGNDTLEEIEK